MIETDKLIIYDFDTIVRTDNIWHQNTIHTTKRDHMMIPMTLVIFSWLVQQQYFKDLTDLDIRKQMYKDQMKT